MNKIILFIFSLFVFLSAQTQEPKWMLSPTIGIDMGGAIPIPLSTIPKGSKGTPKLTPILGLAFQHSINNKWNLGIEANYHVLSFTGTANVISQPFWSDDRTNVIYFSGEAYSTTELRFVEFPLAAYFKLNEHWSIQFGAYYSIILEGKFETEGKNGWMSDDKDITDNAPLPGTQNTNYNFNDELRSNDFGPLFGYQYKISERILFWGRFQAGLVSIFKPEFQNIDYEMYQMRLSTGISFVLVKE